MSRLEHAIDGRAQFVRRLDAERDRAGLGFVRQSGRQQFRHQRKCHARVERLIGDDVVNGDNVLSDRCNAAGFEQRQRVAFGP